MARILLIDDDANLRQMLRLILEQMGHAVTEAEDGKKGLAAYRSSPFDLVITDLIMPEMEGIETITCLRQSSPNLKIIAISGGGKIGPDNYLALARALGTRRTISKPFAIAKFTSTITEVLQEA